MIYLLIIAAVCTAEFLLRRCIRRKLKLNEKKEIKGLPVVLNRHHNHGMAGGKMKDDPDTVKIISGAAIAVFAIILLATLPLKGKKAMKTGLALIVGGGLANLLERLHHGYVTDYVQFQVPFQKIRNLVFNVADFCIFIGSILLALGGNKKEI